MYKYLIAFMFLAAPLFSQSKLNQQTVDSLTYAYFVNNQWDELISLGKAATKDSIDFNFLQQRLGYAYFVKGNYYSAIKHYSQALNFDPYNQTSHTYLYYSALNINDVSMAHYHASKLEVETRKALNIKGFRPVDAVDLEYNYKINKDYASYNVLSSNFRSNPYYKRIGINSQLGYRFNLYQSYSTYSQLINYSNQTIQNEYYVSGSYTLFPRTNLIGAYHFVGTKSNNDSLNIPGNLWFVKLTQSFNRFDISLSRSVFSNDYLDSKQTGLHIGFVLPTKNKIYLKSSLYTISDAASDTSRLVFNQSIGTLIAQRLWLQTGVTLGNLNNYVDNNALYLYNSLDQTTFRTNASLFYYASKHLTFFTNYTFDKKQITKQQVNYKQHSLTGGIIWKL